MSVSLVPDGYDVASLAPSYGVFGPADLTRMVAAFRAALTIASDESGPFGLIGGRRLRASLACAVVDGVKRGVRDVDQLKANALCALAAQLILTG